MREPPRIFWNQIDERSFKLMREASRISNWWENLSYLCLGPLEFGAKQVNNIIIMHYEAELYLTWQTWVQSDHNNSVLSATWLSGTTTEQTNRKKSHVSFLVTVRVQEYKLRRGRGRVRQKCNVTGVAGIDQWHWRVACPISGGGGDALTCH